MSDKLKQKHYPLKIITKNEIWLTRDILPNITWANNALNLKEITVRRTKQREKVFGLEKLRHISKKKNVVSGVIKLNTCL